MTLIEQLSQYAAPFRFSSNWLVRLETHYLGGPRYWGAWEIADVGILVVFRRNGVVERTKIALLQSKRLYPIEAEAPAEDHPTDYELGFGRLLQAEQEFKSTVQRRNFTFSDQSRYRALEYKGEQYKAILNYIVEQKIPVHYLLHNPLRLPSRATLPVEAAKNTADSGSCEIGCRVVSAEVLDSRLNVVKLKKFENPSFAQVAGTTETLDTACWRPEYFVADLVIGCQEGYRGGINPMQDSKLFIVFSRRSGPISAAISITIDASAG